MGYGDEIMGSGVAKRLFATDGRKVAFGDGKKVIWSREAEIIYRNNPKVARPSDRDLSRVNWVTHYSGHRLYGEFRNSRLVIKKQFKADPGEFFFYREEEEFANRLPSGLVIIEPQVKARAPNKQWPVARYKALAAELLLRGHEVAQFLYWGGERPLHPGVRKISTESFRQAAAVLARSKLFIGAEGGLHHASAAVGIPAVVIFGGYISPEITGYASHANISASGEPCGTIAAQCSHCVEAMDSISLDQVSSAVIKTLGGRDDMAVCDSGEAGKVPEDHELIGQGVA